MKNTIAYLAHYFRAAAASASNGGIHAVKIYGGYTGLQTAIPKLGLPAADAHVLLGVFLAASFWAAVDWMNANPLPVITPDAPAKQVPAGVVTAALLCLCLPFINGCSTTAQAEKAASTHLTFVSKDGTKTEVILPKEMDTSKLHLELDPATGKLLLTADALRSSNSQLVGAAGAQEATAIANMSDAIVKLVPAATAAAVQTAAAVAK